MATMSREGVALRALRDQIVHLDGPEGDFSAFIERVGTANVVLLGESTHGTSEFYRARATITERLIEELGFDAVAWEADWPDAYRVNRFVRGVSDEDQPVDALADFRRFPTWMWRNAEVLSFIRTLRRLNDRRPPVERVGVYGLDLYSLHRSMDVVVDYLDEVDEGAGARARERYACFDRFGGDPADYGSAVMLERERSCEQEVAEQLVDLLAVSYSNINRDGVVAEDAAFCAAQNGRVVREAERYYRTMYLGSAASWNLRDSHMVDTLEQLVAFESRRRGRPAKVVVWAHNSHLGDARATSMSRSRELNVGQLVRDRFGERAVNLGFLTYDGTVAAASSWGDPMQIKRVVPARNDSHEGLLHLLASPAFYLDLKKALDGGGVVVGDERLERAIGVIYRPDTELVSHYFTANLAAQFDALVYFDRTHAVSALDRGAAVVDAEPPETYPSGV